MAFALIAQRADALGANGGPSGAFNSTGGDLTVICVSYDVGAQPVGADISDGQSNTYTLIGNSEATNAGVAFFYCAAPTTNAAQVITVSKVNSFSAISIQVWSGAHATPLGSYTENFNNSASTLQPGSLTPPEDNCLIFGGIAFPPGSTFDSVDSSFTLANTVAGSGGVNYGVGSIYKVQTTAGAENPTLTISGATQMAVFQVVMKSAGGAPPDPPNATYAENTQACEGANGTITPTNTGGAITSSAVASGSLPTGYVLNANGTISKTGASMVVGDIGSRTVYVDLTNAGGTQEDVPVPIVITANPPVLSYAGSPFTKFCAHASTTANITATGAAVAAAGYALSSALGGLALNTTTAVLTFDPDLTEGVPVTLRTVTGTSAGGQVGQTVISVRFSYQFTVEGTNAGGSDTSLVTLHLGGFVTGQGSGTPLSSLGRSSMGHSSQSVSSWGGR